jgi:aminomethyltransferase
MTRKTPLYDQHVKAGARLVEFSGFEMPLRYSSDTAEHLAVRNGVGVFDVSHMGEVFIEGDGALAAVQYLCTNDAEAITDGQAMYTGLLNEEGMFVDDSVVYRFHDKKFLICVNAGNREKDFKHIHQIVQSKFSGQATARDDGDLWAQIAVQGPHAIDVVATLCGESVREMKGYHFCEGAIQIASGTTEGIIARTGYTGEDGFELYVPAETGGAVWDAIFAVKTAGEITPCGLACRDTLRLEAGMALYGNDIDDSHTPLEAGLGWTVKLNKGSDFVGSAALRAQKETGVTRRLRGIEILDRGIARHGYPILSLDGETIGEVTSGTKAPYIGKAIAMGYVAKAHASFGNEIQVEVRNRKLNAKIVKLPFYKRDSS